MKSYDVTIQMKPLCQYITFTGYCLSLSILQKEIWNVSQCLLWHFWE